MFFLNTKYKIIIFLFGIFLFPVLTFASITDGIISSPNNFAWGENVGWINLGTTEGDIHITNSSLTGYMWDSVYGWVNLNPTGSGVLNDGNGNLSGFAWSAGAGFIDFTGVTINSSGVFSGIAQGAVYGRLNFSCDTCNVQTDWRPISQQNQSSSAVGPISIFIKKDLVSTSTPIVEGQKIITDIETLYKEVSKTETLYTPNKELPKKELENPVLQQPVIDSGGLPTPKTVTGKSFSTKTLTTKDMTGSEIVYNLIVKSFKSGISKIKNGVVGVVTVFNFLPGSIFIKSIIIFIVLPIVIILLFWVYKYKKRMNS